MATISNASAAGLAYLTQPGNLLSNLPSAVSASTLQSSAPRDVVSLSEAAIQAQQAENLFGTAQTTQYGVQLPAAGATATNSILPGVSSADLTNATPRQTTALNSQALRLQQSAALFGAPPSATVL